MVRRAPLVLLAALVGACADDPEPPMRTALGPPQGSGISFQAVDAGTGAALANPAMTVRYLVRSPITVDAAGVEEVPSTEPFAIREEVADDSLVVEVRLEAASYHRLDTVLAVVRGADAGPFTLRMTRRLERGAGVARPGAGVPSGGGAPPAAEAAPTAAASGFDGAALESGNRAFAAGRWAEAIQAYQRMRLPAGATDAEVRAYQQGRLREGTSHMNLGGYAGALDALEEAVGLPTLSAAAHLRYAQAQCAVGRIEDGRRTLSTLERAADRLGAQERAAGLATAQYVSALCGVSDLDRAQGAIERVRVGNRIIQELQAFVDRAGGVSPRTDFLDAAVADAQRRIEEIRERMRRGG